MSEKRRSWLPWVLLFLLLAVALYADRRRGDAVEKARVAQQAVDSLKALERAVDTVYRHQVDTLRQWRTRWDSIVMPGRTDTLTIERVVYVADSTIRACEAVVATCEVRVGLARERADSAESAAKQWERAAKGPFLRPAVEGTLTPELDWQAAGEVTLGRGKLKLLGRVDIGQGSETCSFVPNTEAYSCSTPVEATVRFGVRWGL